MTLTLQPPPRGTGLILLVLAFILICVLTGCSPTQRMADAEKSQSAAISHERQGDDRLVATYKAKLAKAADLNREIGDAIASPLPTGLPVATQLLSLQYNLTGNAETAADLLQRQVDVLLKDDNAAHAQLATMGGDVNKLNADLRTQTAALAEERIKTDAATAKATALAMSFAAEAEAYSHLKWTVGFCIAGVVLVVGFFIAARLGVLGAGLAAKAALL
jgi:hypothetical protein